MTEVPPIWERPPRASVYAVGITPLTDTPTTPECFVTRIASMFRCGAGLARDHLVLFRDNDGVSYQWRHPRVSITYHPAFPGRWGYVEDDGTTCSAVGSGGNPAEAQRRSRELTRELGLSVDTDAIDESLRPMALVALLPPIPF